MMRSVKKPATTYPVWKIVLKRSKAVRSHWGVENGLHWKLDIGFREDECRKRKGNAAANFAIMRQIALNLLNQEKTIVKAGVKAKRLRAGWDNNYLLNVLNV